MNTAELVVCSLCAHIEFGNPISVCALRGIQSFEVFLFSFCPSCLRCISSFLRPLSVTKVRIDVRIYELVMRVELN